MRNLLNFLIRFNSVFIFLILEGITLYLLATGNNYQNTIVLNGIRGLTYRTEAQINRVRDYLNLREVNDKLAAENLDLKKRLESFSRKQDQSFYPVTDTVYRQQYTHTSAEVIGNTVNRQKNFFMLNKGRHQGIFNDMAVVSTEGVAGVIVGVSENYSVAMSVLNLDFRLSARIRSNGYFGSLAWDGRDYKHALLNEIPQHINISVGDTIETTGFSSVFPEGLIVGIVSDFEKRGGDFYRISVELKTDFKSIHYVDVIGNLRKEERIELEKAFK
jgi:rod shape-determining protein MreC